MERKEIVKALGEHLGTKPKYLGAPSFAYAVKISEETYTIDKQGNITNKEGRLMSLDEILDSGNITDKILGNNRDDIIDDLGIDSLEIKLPIKGHTAISIQNVINMLYSKQNLMLLSFDSEIPFMDDTFAEDLSKETFNSLDELDEVFKKLGKQRCPGLVVNTDTIIYKLDGIQMDSEKLNAFRDLCVLINKYSMELKHSSFKQSQDDNPKYAFRTWLNRIGMKGSEYKETRKIFLKNLEGSCSFRMVGEDKNG